MFLLANLRSSKLSFGTVKFRNDHVAKILGYGDYQIGNVTIIRVYLYVKDCGHNLFSLRQFWDSNLEVAFRQHALLIHNLESELIYDWNLEAQQTVYSSLGYHDGVPQIRYVSFPRPLKTNSYFDELTVMASEHNSSGPALHEMTHCNNPDQFHKRLQLHEQALFCYDDAFLNVVEPKTYKDALTQSLKPIQLAVVYQKNKARFRARVITSSRRESILKSSFAPAVDQIANPAVTARARGSATNKHTLKPPHVAPYLPPHGCSYEHGRLPQWIEQLHF
ncbi:hypothetical protein Tco_0909250 [Tanacetum coccineum]|uniref:Integrase, catalytic region, zinc finger, CCHC-type, peptidase aspartic, catalytic n=1 Tax=Tanacetum coccineum TaxID=301880 RepID=A0ABQ5CQP4_9ASTR